VKDRKRQRRRFEARLLELATPYPTAPQRVLAQRIERYGHEMFTFVEDPRIPPENNAAERAVRPAVIARKVSGGSRSDDGTKTRMTLMSLFGTWLLRGLDGVEACRALLSGRSLLFPEPV
jgi:transposase